MLRFLLTKAEAFDSSAMRRGLSLCSDLPQIKRGLSLACLVQVHGSRLLKLQRPSPNPKPSEALPAFNSKHNQHPPAPPRTRKDLPAVFPLNLNPHLHSPHPQSRKPPYTLRHQILKSYTLKPPRIPKILTKCYSFRSRSALGSDGSVSGA